NDITLSYLRYHSFSLLSGVVYMSLMVIALWKICNGVGVEVEREESGKSDCSKMLLGLPLALLPFLFGIQVCLCCFRRIGIRRLEEDFYAEDEQEVTPTISLSSLPPQTTPITETNRITVQTPEDGNH
uniref:hypothetical protein n=1 Tax=Candidatus Ichthyocystis hellenicum TaxID=1561003 RepID=UPI001F5F8EF2